jgi:hypothetical protein
VISSYAHHSVQAEHPHLALRTRYNGEFADCMQRRLYGIIPKHRALAVEASSQIILVAWVSLALVALVVAIIFYRLATAPSAK